MVYLYSSYKNIFAPKRHLHPPPPDSIKIVYFLDLVLVVGNIDQNGK